MKKHLLPLTLASLVVLLGTSAQAALTYSSGDLLLGFRAAGAANNYVVNLGAISQYTAQNGASFSVNTGGNIGGDLASANGFGSNWFTNSDLSWGIIGTTFFNTGDLEVLYATRARLNAAIQTQPWRGRSPSGQTQSISLIQALAFKYAQDGQATANSTRGTFQAATAENSWASLTSGTNDFIVGGNIEGSFAEGAAASVLDFYRIDPVFNQSATYLGSFTISNTGAITFTAVPEPSVLALALLGVGLLALRLRHRRTA